MFGIGAAWYEREHTALGIPYPPVSQRFEMLEEMINVGPFPGNPDPVGFIRRLGDELAPKLAEIA